MPQAAFNERKRVTVEILFRVPAALRWRRLCSRFGIALIPSIALLLLTGCEAARSGSPMSAVCGSLTSQLTPHQPVDGRVDESGLLYSFSLEVNGCKGKDVGVQLYATDASNRETFLAKKKVTATYDDTEWKEYSMFVPLSRFANANPTTGYVVYVESPTKSEEYIAKVSYTLATAYDPGIIWTWTAWKDEAVVSPNVTGFHMETQLNTHGYPNKSFDSVVILEDASGNTVTSASGAPLVLPSQNLTSIYEKSQWNGLSLNVPYNEVSHFSPAQLIYARPGIRLDSGELLGGNIYFKFWAGGSLETIYTIYQAESGRLGEEIKRLQMRNQAMEGSNP